MVKGISRRVVVVQPEDRALFEQAIFFVRDYSTSRADLVREACRIANGYLAGRPRAGRGRSRVRLWHLAAAFALGAVVVGAAWLLCALL